MRSPEATAAEMLGESVARFLSETCGFYERRPAEATGAYSLDRVWEGLAQIGALGLTVPEPRGGAGAGAAEAFVVCRELGRVALSTPYVSTALLASTALLEADPELQDEVLPRIIEGRSRVAVVASDFGAPTGGEKAGLAGRRVGEHEVSIEGYLSMLLHLQGSDLVMSSLRFGDAADTDYLVFLPVAALSEVSTGRFYDGTPVAAGRVEKAVVHARRVVKVSADLRQRMRLLFALGCASEASGLADALVQVTADYLRSRTAFGQTLDRFQALQHRMADLRMSQEAIRSCVALLIHALQTADCLQRERLRHAALAALGGHVRRIGKEAIQLHGATGAMWEHFAGAGLPRLMVLQQLCGNPDQHTHAYAHIVRDELPTGAYRPLF